jgi:precorrin-4/cobalt-precorrin-4 C11-methyltransferase
VISFVGAGPGAPDLITLRGADRLAGADVVIWAASLVPADVLQHCRPGVELHDSKTMTLEDVCAVYASHPDHTAIVRLHSGDPTLYSAIGEQLAWCRANGRAFEVVPGVSSMSAAAACAERELTLPGVAQSVVLTRLASGTRRSMPEGERLDAFAAVGPTMVVFLSAAHVEELVDQLLGPSSAYDRETPVVVAHRATWPDEVMLTSTLGTLAHDVREAGFTATTLFLVGPALGGETDHRSHVYAPDYATRYRTSDVTHAAGHAS